MISNRPKRLAGVDYTGHQRYFVTCCTAHRHRAFEQRATYEACLLQLRHSATVHDFEMAAYCFMPDHLHLLVYGTSQAADLRKFVSHFKQLTGFAHRRRFGQSLWQPGYHERVLRDEESTGVIAPYVLGNPIRAGISSAWGEYPFAGSDLYDYRQA